MVESVLAIIRVAARSDWAVITVRSVDINVLPARNPVDTESALQIIRVAAMTDGSADIVIKVIFTILLKSLESIAQSCFFYL